MYASIYLKFPTGADIPLPVFFKVAAGGAFHIKIDMAVSACRKSGTHTILKPGILKAGVSRKAIAQAIGHRNRMAAAKLVQQISLGINNAPAAHLFADIESDAAYSALDPALRNFDTITGKVVIAAQVT